MEPERQPIGISRPSQLRHQAPSHTRRDFCLARAIPSAIRFLSSHPSTLATALVIVTLLVALGCSRPPILKVDGSSTVFPITEAMAEEFQKEDGNFRVTVGISGTGGGFKRFCNGETAITNASRPIKPIEVDACNSKGVEYIELPVAFDGLSIVVHPDNDWVDRLTVDELEEIWRPGSTVKRWSDVRPEWPDRSIDLVGADTDSGTFDYFTRAIVGEEGASRPDYTASADDNVLCEGRRGGKVLPRLLRLRLLHGEHGQSEAGAGGPGHGARGALHLDHIQRHVHAPQPSPLYLREQRKVHSPQDPTVRSILPFSR